MQARGTAAEDKLRAVLHSWSGEAPLWLKSQWSQLKQQLRGLIESTKRAAMAEIARCEEEQKLPAVQQRQQVSAVDMYESLAVPHKAHHSTGHSVLSFCIHNNPQVSCSMCLSDGWWDGSTWLCFGCSFFHHVRKASWPEPG